MMTGMIVAGVVIGFLLGAGIGFACVVAGSDRHERIIAAWRNDANHWRERAEAAELRAGLAEAQVHALKAARDRERVRV